MKEEVERQYRGGRLTAFSHGELLELARRHLPDLFDD